jgi:predicted PhzF superfamily epimerase YddE/YHI9
MFEKLRSIDGAGQALVFASVGGKKILSRFIFPDNGPGWVAVLLADAESVLALRPGLVPDHVGVAGPYPEGAPCDFEVRAFTHAHGSTIEDPVTGSLNASMAQWLLRSGRAKAPYVASQGTVLGFSGRVHISTDAEGDVWVGGSVLTCVTGQVEL